MHFTQNAPNSEDAENKCDGKITGAKPFLLSFKTICLYN